MSWRFPEAFTRSLRAAVEAALVAEAQGTLAEAYPTVPYEKGNLDASGEVLPPAWSGDVCTVVAGFGGTPEAAPYAIVQHERLDFRHPGGRTAKYLERPAMARAPGAPGRIAAAVAKELGT